MFTASARREATSMARAIWTGSITFGMVSIPVGLFSATEDHTIHFHQLQRGTSDRVRNKRVNERTGDEVDYADVVKGADIGGGEHVVVEQDELASVAPGRSHSLEITGFVDPDEIDPVYFRRTYWLAPTDEQYERPYALLVSAMERVHRVGVGTFVMRGKEYLTAVRPDNGLLALETLYFADEVRDPSDRLENVPPRGREKGKELEMAAQLVEAMSVPWRPEDYHDTYRDRVQKLIEDKRQGNEIVSEPEPPEPTEMSDLLANLERSVAASREGGKGGKGRESGRGGKGGKGRKGGGERRSDLAEASKSELAELARRYDIPGRSSMNRAELAEAVDEATRESSRDRRAS